MTDAEAIALLLPILEGLDVIAEQMDLFAYVFDEQELLSDEAGQEED